MKLIAHPALLDLTVFLGKPLLMLAQQVTIAQLEPKIPLHALKELIMIKNQEKVSTIAKSVLLVTCAKLKVSHISLIILANLDTFVLKELLGTSTALLAHTLMQIMQDLSMTALHAPLDTTVQPTLPKSSAVHTVLIAQEETHSTGLALQDTYVM